MVPMPMDDYDVDCYTVGNGGNCGVDCPVFVRGECEQQDEAIENIIYDHGADIRSIIGTGLYEEEVDDMIVDMLDERVETKQKDTFTDFDRAMDVFK